MKGPDPVPETWIASCQKGKIKTKEAHRWALQALWNICIFDKVVQIPKGKS